MRRLMALLSALLVLTIFASSDVSAARSSFELRIQSIAALIRTTAFPFCGSFFFMTEGEIPVSDDGSDCILGGDADDFGNGRITGDGIANPGSTLTTIIDCADSSLERIGSKPRLDRN